MDAKSRGRQNRTNPDHGARRHLYLTDPWLHDSDRRENPGHLASPDQRHLADWRREGGSPKVTVVGIKSYYKGGERSLAALFDELSCRRDRPRPNEGLEPAERPNSTPAGIWRLDITTVG